MKEQFIPYELAIELRNLGFDDYVFAFYWTDTKQLILDSPDYLGKHNGVHLQAPLWQQSFDYFRIKYKYSGEVYYFESADFGKWHFDIEPLTSDGERYTISEIEGFKTYEEARQVCLEKLIETVKNEQNKD